MQLNRRHFVLGGLAAGASLTLTATAFAGAPLAGAQVAGVYRRKLGSLEITALLDGYLPLNAEIFSGTPPEEIARILADAGFGQTLPTSVNAFVVNTGEKTYLLDTGTGTLQAFGPTVGRMATNLLAAGIKPEQIDGIVLTHAHPDHAEGLVDANGAAVFANAELVLHEKEAAFWADDSALSGAPDAMKPLFASARKTLGAYKDRTRPIAGGEAFPGIALELAAGHTPGHSIVRVASGSEQFALVGDTIANVAVHTARPDTAFVFDIEPAAAIVSRKRVFDMVATDGMLIAGSHIPFPGFGTMRKTADAYRFIPATWAFDL